jgi:hypothetical protein
MKIAIHHCPGSFSDKWLEYCHKHQIDTKLVNCYDSDIISQIADCDGLMWHWAHWDYEAIQFARQLTYSLEIAGKKVFPDSRTCWHFDDKIGQKYLLEAVDAPLISSYVFYEKRRALAWLDNADFPKVFKLRRGAGSANVILIRSKSQARRVVRKAFGRGFSPVNRLGLFKDRIWHLRRDRNIRALIGIGKGLARLLVPTQLEENTFREKGYVYFQDFIPDNTFDIRIIVIGDRAFGIKRLVREDDFRASGSGLILSTKSDIDTSCLRPSFEICQKIGSQCLAFDYVFLNKRPLLTEVSYAFLQSGYRNCPGYWDGQLAWHEGDFCPEWFMIEDFINSIVQKSGPAYEA